MDGVLGSVLSMVDRSVEVQSLYHMAFFQGNFMAMGDDWGVSELLEQTNPRIERGRSGIKCAIFGIVDGIESL